MRYSWNMESRLAFGAYVILTANDSIIKAWSKGSSRTAFPYSVFSVMLMSGVVSLVIGVATAVSYEGREGLRKCANLNSIKKVARVNIFFQFAGYLKFKALTRVPPDAVSILSQMNLFILALTVQFFTNKVFSRMQWVSLVMTCAGVVLYMSSREGQSTLIGSLLLFVVATGCTFSTLRDSQQKGFSRRLLLLRLALQAASTILVVDSWPKRMQQNRHIPELGVRAHLSADVWQGVLCILGMCCCECFASVCLEVFFKQETLDPKESCNFYIQKVHVDCSSILFSFLWAYVQGVLQDGDTAILGFFATLFTGWDRSTCVVLLQMVCKAWLAGLVAKFLDSVVKQIGSCMAIALMFVELNFIFTPFASVGTTASVAVVVLAILHYMTSSLNIDNNTKKHSGDDAGRRVLDDAGRRAPDDPKWTANYASMSRKVK